MLRLGIRIRAFVILIASLASLFVGELVFGQGAYLSTAGPVSRGMGGASTAAPIDALGALYWNPATISGLEHSELEFGLDLLLPFHSVTSTVGAVTGTTDGEAGAVPVPNIGWVYHTTNPAITFGLSVNSVAGLKTNLPVDPTNPILAPAPAGLGRVSSEGMFLTVNPVISIALSERLSIAAGPTIGLAQVRNEPFVFDAANPNGAYSPAQASRYHWGGGAQAGVYYIHDENWRFGASIKTPTWFETFRAFGETDTGLPRVVRTDIDLPLILSFGTAYAVGEEWLFAADVRFMDYANAEGFGDPTVYDAQGRLAGLGWNSVFGISLGAQRKLNDKVYLRAGYTFNQNPVDETDSFFNIGTPLIYEHMFSGGASYQLNDLMALSCAYSYMLNNDATGQIVLPGIGAIPGSSLTNELDVHVLSFGVVMRH